MYRKIDANLILRLHKPDLMARFMEIKPINSRKTQKKLQKKLVYSSSTLQRYRKDTKMRSTYESSNPKRTQKTSNDLKRPQITSKDANENVKPVSEKVKTENNLKVAIQILFALVREGSFLNKLFQTQGKDEYLEVIKKDSKIQKGNITNH